LFVTVGLVAGTLSSVAAEEKADGALMEPVKSVYDNYMAIQKELAKDSLKGVSEHASAIAKAVRGDEMKMLPMDVAKQADGVAKAEDLRTAREAFKGLSGSLVKYLADHKAGKGLYHEVYCPMARASWLQTEKNIKNPYMGTAMLTCGELKN
jgi:Cu(I)/Ag(I) efflux system membrane fusion protein